MFSSSCPTRLAWSTPFCARACAAWASLSALVACCPASSAFFCASAMPASVLWSRSVMRVLLSSAFLSTALILVSRLETLACTYFFVAQPVVRRTSKGTVPTVTIVLVLMVPLLSRHPYASEYIGGALTVPISRPRYVAENKVPYVSEQSQAQDVSTAVV